MTKHYRYGGSGAARLVQCPGNLNARDKLTKVPGNNAAAQRGTNLHEIQEVLRNNNWLPEELDIPKMFPELTAEELEDYTQTTDLVYTWVDHVLDKYNLEYIISEPLVKVDEDTGGSIDHVAYNDEYCAVIDHKMGYNIVKAKDNEQGLFYLWALSKSEEYAHLVEGKKLIFVITQPSQGDPDIWEIPKHWLRRFEERYLKAVEISKQADAPLGAGPACKFCGNGPYCDELKRYAKRALTLHKDQKESLLESLEIAALLKGWAGTVATEAENVLRSGESLPGYKLVEKQARRKWRDESYLIDRLYNVRNKAKYFEEPKLLTPAQMEKVREVPEHHKKMFKNNTLKESTGVTIAPASDKRRAVSVEIPDALKKLVENKK